jgi:zinc protease
MVMETPQTYVSIVSSAKMPYTYTNRTLASMAGQVLTKRLLAKIREEMGAVYSISASAYLERLGDKNFTLTSNFPMKPEMKDEVLSEIHKMYFDMADNISDDELNPIKEFMIKSVKESMERNEGWGNAISGSALNGVDVLNGAVEAIGKITTADLKAFVKQVLDQNNYRVYVLEPTEK